MTMLLMTPGPTRVPERVLRAGARPMIHHRTPEFAKELATVLELLPPIFGTTQPILPVHTTGRGALEATICNLFSVGDEIAVCCNGKFGEMWAGFAESYGVVVHRIETDWEQSVSPNAVDAFLAEHRQVKAVAMTYADSSTGVANDVAAVARIAGERGVLTLVDGVSSIGGMPFELDAWGVDVTVTASQKCLMSSPGLAFVAMSERAWRASESARLPRNYWSFTAIRSEVSKAKPETPGTTPVHLMLQVAEALRMIHEEGFANVLLRHRQMAERVRATVAGNPALGLSLQCPALVHRASTLTAIALPTGIAPAEIRGALKARDILIAAGLGPYQATAFRIGHMGDIRMSDVERTLAALAEVLSSQPASVG
jgi:aspartate aminotransferase-like enzyme